MKKEQSALFPASIMTIRKPELIPAPDVGLLCFHPRPSLIQAPAGQAFMPQ